MAVRSSKKNPELDLLTGLIIILLTASLSYLISLHPVLENLEQALYDWNFKIRGVQDVTDSDLVVVAIDQNTADSLSFPFDRRHYATLIQKLNRLGARWIVFDIQFTSTGSIPESDSIFYAAILEAGNVALVGKIDYHHVSGFQDPLRKVVRPVPEVSPPGTWFGLADDLTDADGFLRQYPLYMADNDSAFLSLGLKVLQIDQGWFEEDFTASQELVLHFGTLQIPRVHLNATLLNYSGPAGTFPAYSFVDVIEGVYDFDDYLSDLTAEEMELLEAAGALEIMSESPFQDKIVLIGASAEDLQDNKFTPFFSSRNPRKTPGVEVHAHAIRMFQTGTFLQYISFNWILVLVLLISMIAFFMLRYRHIWIGLIGSLVLLAAIKGVGYYLFAHQYLVIYEMPLMLAVALGYPINLIYRLILIQREKAQIRGMFGHYVADEIIDELLENPEKLKLGGERRRMTMLFTDVAGFTTVSEALSPEDMINLLNEYLTPLTRIIRENRGLIDKYEGDLIMAEWGAPVWFEEHASCACRSALLMQKKLVELRAKWRSEGRHELFSRVGINTGDVSLGNLGSEEVFDYSVIGDAVNLASRLEGANKNYNTTIMIGHNTWLDVKDSFVTRKLDSIRVKGKKQGVLVYELIAEHRSEVSEEKLQCLEIFGQGLELYFEAQFAAAREQFELALTLVPDDPAALVFRDRCGMYIESPPPEDWDAVWELTEK